MDESGPLRIRVNTQNTVDMNALSTFSTLAMREFPGHMYASAYSYQNLSSDFRKVLASQTGYNEGYATYVELLSLGYLEEQGIPAEVLEMERLNAELSNCLVTIMDISVNYDGMSREEFADAFSMYIDPSFADYYYDMMRLEPTAYLSYYAGWLKLESLREGIGGYGSQMEDLEEKIRSTERILLEKEHELKLTEAALREIRSSSQRLERELSSIETEKKHSAEMVENFAEEDRRKHRSGRRSRKSRRAMPGRIQPAERTVRWYQ